MEVIVRPNADTATELVARIITRAVKTKIDLVLGLATGRTMEALYARLVKAYLQREIRFSHVTTFNLDEYIGLAPENPMSYRSYMQRHLFDHIDINRDDTHIPNGLAENVDQECARYESMIATVGGIDLQLLGIGRSGHIGFNEPLSSMFSRTRAKALTPETIAQNATLFPSPDMMPRRAITMGVGTILETRRCILLATGAEKAHIVAKAVEGPVTSMVSATALQLHKRCTVVVDEDAAAELTQLDYYRWVFENEPEWRDYHS